MNLVEMMVEKERIVADNCEKVMGQIEIVKKTILARAFRGELGTNNQEEESSIELLRTIMKTE